MQYMHRVLQNTNYNGQSNIFILKMYVKHRNKTENIRQTNAYMARHTRGPGVKSCVTKSKAFIYQISGKCPFTSRVQL